MKRDSMVLYRSFLEAAEGLPAEDFKECILSIARYAMDGIEPNCNNPTVRLFFTLTRPQVDANNRKYENGKRGGRPAKAGENQTGKKPNQNQSKTKSEPTGTEEKPNVNVNDNENVNVNAIEREGAQDPRPRFKKPDQEVVAAFFKANGMAEDEAKKFYNHYQSNGWKVGKNPMEDWKAAALIWQSRQRDFSGSVKAGSRLNSFDQRSYDYNQIEKLLDSG